VAGKREKGKGRRFLVVPLGRSSSGQANRRPRHHLRRVPREKTFGHLATIVKRIRQRGAAVVLVGVTVGLLSDPYIVVRYE
jgi:hypothetical protein